MSSQIVYHDHIGDELQPLPTHYGEIDRVIKERLIGRSRWSQTARAAVAAHAAHNNPIILDGERGTGKKHLARLIHDCSPRAQRPFVTLSCEGISEESAEAALFGSIRTLPSGHNRIQRGLVETAEGGTLYISGLSTLSSLLRVQIARLIQYQEFRRVQGDVLETVDTRVILGFASSPNSDQEVTWTLETATLAIRDTLSLPPLRQRKVDIEPLCRHFIKQSCQKWGKEMREISSDTIVLLRRYAWPGNVGELKSVIEGMIQRSRPSLEPSLLPPSLIHPTRLTSPSLPASGINLEDELKEMEKSHLWAALKQCQGSQAQAARLLGLKLSTLRSKLIRYHIDASSFKDSE